MLLTKKLEVGDIITIKLVTGEEIIGKLKALGDKVLEISKPIAIGMSPQGIALLPFMISADEEVNLSFDMKMVVTYTPTRQELKDAYIENTTGITTASGLLPGGLVKG